MDALHAYQATAPTAVATSIFDGEDGRGVCKWEGSCEIRYDAEKRHYFSTSRAQQSGVLDGVIKTTLQTKKERDTARAAIREAADEIEGFFGNEASTLFLKEHKNQLEAGEPLTADEIKNFSQRVAARKNQLEDQEQKESISFGGVTRELRRNIDIVFGGRSVGPAHSYQEIPSDDKKSVAEEPLVGFHNKHDFSKTLNPKPLFEMPKVPFLERLLDPNKPVLKQADFEGKEIVSKLAAPVSNSAVAKLHAKQRGETREANSKDSNESTPLLG